ncbi:MAG: ATP synthase F1 subunit gamma [Anaerolineales bacterium]|nr:ATP synthase F1 subunit gamma [Anaerolineales bacterium]
MATPREVQLRIRSVKNIAQVTRALQAVSASKARKAQQAVMLTRPYATKAWQVLNHIAAQPVRDTSHPLLTIRPDIRRVLVVLITGDRGLAGAYNANIVRFAMRQFADYPVPVKFISVGKKGRDYLLRLRQDVIAEFSNLPPDPSYGDVSAIGNLAVDEFLTEKSDEVYLVYTDFISMLKQVPAIKKLLPLEFDEDASRVVEFGRAKEAMAASYIYEPNEAEILDEIVPRFTALQVYHAILESLASEHAARMVAMKNATDSATDLAAGLTLEYNKARQQAITNEMIDIVGGSEAIS